jgi:hypothetical protein
MPPSDTNSENLPNGPAWACILAAGIACFTFGLTIDLAEAFKPVSNALNFYKPTGDLSGKTTLAIIIWAITWGILHARWKHQNLKSPQTIMVLTLFLILLALIAAFPPFFDLFAAG